MAEVGAESMFGGTMFRQEMIQREISRVLVLSLSGKPNSAQALPRRGLSLTEPSLLSRRTPSVFQIRENQTRSKLQFRRRSSPPAC